MIDEFYKFGYSIYCDLQKYKRRDNAKELINDKSR